MPHESTILLRANRRRRHLLRCLAAVRTGTEWVENPNPPEPIEPTTEPTNQDIMDALEAMQGDQVPAATLDAAYREGVNAYV